MKFEYIKFKSVQLLEMLENESIESIEVKYRKAKEISLILELQNKTLLVEGKKMSQEFTEIELQYVLNWLYRFSDILYYKKLGSVYKVIFVVRRPAKAEAKIIFLHTKAA